MPVRIRGKMLYTESDLGEALGLTEDEVRTLFSLGIFSWTSYNGIHHYCDRPTYSRNLHRADHWKKGGKPT